MVKLGTALTRTMAWRRLLAQSALMSNSYGSNESFALSAWLMQVGPAIAAPHRSLSYAAGH